MKSQFKLSFIFCVLISSCILIAIALNSASNHGLQAKRPSREFNTRVADSLKRLDELSQENCGQTPESYWVVDYNDAAYDCPIEDEDVFPISSGPKLKQSDDEDVDQQDEYSNTTQPINRLSNGYEIRPGEFPSYAYLEFRNNDTSSENITVCGGILVNNDVILTAAHCILEDHIAGRATLGYVNDSLTELMQVRFVWGYCKMPGFTFDPSFGSYNDMALVQLRSPVQYTNYVQPACIGSNQPHRSEALCYAVGRGKTNEEMNSSNKLIGLPMKRTCTNYPPWLDEGGRSCYQSAWANIIGNTCMGDSGGPVYCLDKCEPLSVPNSKPKLRQSNSYKTRQFAMGVVSFIPKELCKKNQASFTVFTDFYKQRDKLAWMLKNCHETIPPENQEEFS